MKHGEEDLRRLKNLFNKESDYKEIEWNKLRIGELSQDDIKVLIRDEFNKLSQKTKKLLTISSNMYML